jgi:hypothetical protein
MKTVGFSLGVTTLCVMAGLPALTSAQSSQVAMSMAAQVQTPHPIKVSNCSPQRNVSYNWSGYTPGYWPYGGAYGG